jgi:RNA polymerase sigma factor (sigma-70 family)
VHRRLDELARDRSAQLLERVRAMLGPRARRAADSLDFVQEAWAEFLVSPAAQQTFDEDGLVRRLCAIARNNARDAARRPALPHLESALGEGLDGDALAGSQRTPSSILGHAEQLRGLVAQTRGLAPELREVVEWRCLDGLTFAEIALRSGRHEDTVRKAYYRAVVLLSRRS